jgi:hypothetical protein
MTDPRFDTTPKTQPYKGSGPPDPPDKTSRGFGDQSSGESSKIRVTVPEAIQVEVMSYLNLLSGVITNIEQGEASWSIIGATLPTGYLQRFKAWLGDFSGGQARIAEDPA